MNSPALPFIPVLETPRFYLREMSVEDADFAYALNADPEVVKYTGDEPFPSPEAARLFLRNYDHYKKYGMGRWLILDRNTLEPKGWCGLKTHEAEGYVDLGYRLFRKEWGKGIATETSLACIQYGFQKLGLKRIVARAEKLNVASINVMKKCGMSYHSEYKCHGEDGVMYEIKT